MKTFRLLLPLFLVSMLGGCRSFSTVTLAGPKAKIESAFDIIAQICRAHGYQVAASAVRIPGYNRYANDQRNLLVRAWEKPDGTRIHEFWRDDRFVVLIYTRNSLSRRYAEELRAKLVAAEPALDVVIEEQGIVDFT